jgi:tetratricopeptide (TPR) repeat protein
MQPLPLEHRPDTAASTLAPPAGFDQPPPPLPNFPGDAPPSAGGAPQTVVVMAFSIRYGDAALQYTLANDLETSRQNALTAMAHQLESQGAMVEHMTQQTLFAVFKPPAPVPPETPDSILIETAQYAASQCLALAQAFQKQYGHALVLQTGLDIDLSAPRNPFIATPERMAAPPQAVAASQRFLQLLGPNTPYIELSPVMLGDQAMVCYQLLNSGADASQPAIGIPEPLPVSPVVAPQAPEPLLPVAPPLSEVPSAATLEPSNPSPAHSDSPPLAEPMSAPPSIAVVPPPPSAETPIPAPNTQALPNSLPPPYTPSGPSLPEVDQWIGPGPIRPSNANYESAIQSIAEAVCAFSPAIDPLPNPESVPALGGTVSAVRASKPRCIQLMASDGVGKSNILQVARLQADPKSQNAIWLGANAYRSQADNILPLGLWLELFQNFFGLPLDPAIGSGADQVAQESSSQTVDTVLQSIFIQAPIADIAAPLKQFLGLAPVQPLTPDAGHHAKIFEKAVQRLFEGLSQQKPVVVVLEDLQYADAPSLKFLVHLLSGPLAYLPILFVLTLTRDTYPQGDLAELLASLQSQVLVVAELDETEILRFLEHGPLAGSFETFPHDILQPLMLQSRGITLYLEEGLRLLHAQGLLNVNPETGKYSPVQERVDALAGPIELPATVQTVVLARLQHLPEPVARVLQWAASLGERFAISTLATLCQLDGPTFDASLRQLWEQGFILPDGGNSGRFRHGLLWKVVWDNTPSDYRLQLSTAVAECYGQTIGQPVYGHPAKTVHYATLAQAADLVFHGATFAAAYYGGIGAITLASHYLQLALTWIPHSSQQHDPNVQMRLRENLGILNVETYPAFASQQLEPVVVWSRHQSDLPKLVEAAGYLMLAHEKQGRYADNVALLQNELLPLVLHSPAPTTPGHQGVDVGWSMQSTLLNQWMHLGRLGEAQTLIQSHLEPWGNNHFDGNHPLFVKTYLDIQSHKATIALAQAHHQGLVIIDDALRLAEGWNVPASRLQLLLIQAEGLLLKGWYKRCEKALNQTLELIETLQNPPVPLMHWHAIACQFHIALGDWPNARAMLLVGTQYAESTQHHYWWTMFKTLEGFIDLGENLVTAANQHFEDAIALCTHHRYLGIVLHAWRGMAALYRRTHAFDNAVATAGNALRIAEDPHNAHIYQAYLLANELGQAQLAAGDFQSAGRLLEHYWPTVNQTNMVALVAPMAESIGQLYTQLCQQPANPQALEHRQLATAFTDKALHLWQRANNPYRQGLIQP